MTAAPFEIGPCYLCKEPMWMTRESWVTYKRSGQTFHCIHGHKQCFVAGKTDAQKLREELDAERQKRQRAEQNTAYWEDAAREAGKRAETERRRANGYKGFAAKITKRAKAGICPCCNRYFVKLARHMTAKHPTFTPLELETPAERITVQ